METEKVIKQVEEAIKQEEVVVKKAKEEDPEELQASLELAHTVEIVFRQEDIKTALIQMNGQFAEESSVEYLLLDPLFFCHCYSLLVVTPKLAWIGWCRFWWIMNHR